MENKQLASESSKHKRELDALKEKDPEFYAYLQVREQQAPLHGTSLDKVTQPLGF